jgi:hypothetical protein
MNPFTQPDGKALYKTPHVNLPVSIPADWLGFFAATAGKLGISRNAAVCLALKLGGPLLHENVLHMADALRRECARMRQERCVSKILGIPPDGIAVAKSAQHERRNRKHPRPGRPAIARGRQKGG